MRKSLIACLSLMVILLSASYLTSCKMEKSSEKEDKSEETAKTAPEGVPAALPAGAEEIAKARGLTPQDVEAALKTYVPTGKYDDYIMFSSGGHSGQVLVIGVPSMRLPKVIAAYTPEPWQGFGYGSKESMDVLKGGYMPVGKNGTLTWADTHHPALSETDGDYDGQFVFIDDKANARIAVIDLRDFETKQIVKSPNIISDHGATFATQIGRAHV